MVSNASDDLPEPDSPVSTTSLLRGISTSMFLRLCSRAPLTTILSMNSAHDAGSRSRGRPSYHLRGEVERGEEALGARETFPGDVVGHAVVGRGAHDGEADGDVHGLLEVEELHGDQTLVVVHG